MPYQVSREDFGSLHTPWARLLSQVPGTTVFLTPLWLQTWWQHLGWGELSLLSVRHQGQVVGIAPLMRNQGHVYFLGGPDVADYHDFLLEPGCEVPALSALLDFLSTQDWESLELTSFPEHSLALRHLPSLARDRGLQVQAVAEGVCPRLELPGTWEDYLASLSRKDRHELRRKLRRLYGQEVRHYALTDPEEVAQGMDDFLRLLRASREEKAAFLTPEREAFLRAMVAALAGEGQVCLFFLEVSGVRVAAALCFHYGGELSLYNSGYDPAYASLSVGLLLKALCLREAIEMGGSAFDFLRGSEAYKYDLGGQDRQLCQLIVRR